MAEILPFFAVPFGFAKLDNCEPLNQELRTLFLARSAAGGEHANPRPLTQRHAGPVGLGNGRLGGDVFDGPRRGDGHAAERLPGGRIARLEVLGAGGRGLLAPGFDRRHRDDRIPASHGHDHAPSSQECSGS